MLLTEFAAIFTAAHRVRSNKFAATGERQKGSRMKTIINGNEAFAIGAINSGLQFFSGYPITPSTDVMEYLAKVADNYNIKYNLAESEISAINMVFGAASAGARAMTATSGPGFSLMQEAISYMAADNVPCVILNVMREGAGLGDIKRSQGDYFQMTKGGGHGDYHPIVLSCNSIKDCYNIPKLAFNLAEKYMSPVIVTYDADIGHLKENIDINIDIEKHNIDYSEYLLKGCKKGCAHRTIQNVYYHHKDYDKYLYEKYKNIEDNEQRYESYKTEDAEIILVAFGIMSRVAKDVVNILRSKNIKIGLINPITLYPFPNKAFESLNNNVKKIYSLELNILSQMTYDIRLAVKNKIEIKKIGKMSTIPLINDIINIIGEDNGI